LRGSSAAHPLRQHAGAGTLFQEAQGLHRQGALGQAARLYRDILKIEPEHVVAYFHLANALRDLKQLDDAAAAYRRALEIEPAFITAWNNLGTVLKDLKRGDEAMACYRRALDLKPDYAVAHNNLGVALKDTEQYAEAEASYRRAIELEPGYFRAHCNLGKTLHETGRYAEAQISYRQALAIQPDFAEAYDALADTLQAIGQVQTGIDHYRRSLELRPDNTEILSKLLFVHNYVAELSPDTMRDEARRYGTLALARAVPFKAWRTRPILDKRLRVGFVSGDLLTHPVGFFLESTLAELDPDAVELYAYSNNPREDALTLRIKPCFSVWRRTHELEDAALAQRIHDDAIDILIDLSGHTGLNRLPVFAWKPAPVQLSWLGYFATTGVPGMDYFLGDPHVCPPDEEKHFSETVWRLPHTYYCFTPPGLNIQPSPLPARTNGFVTFACFNKLAKMGDAVVETWSRILAAVPDSRLFLKAAEYSDDKQGQAVRERYAAHGIAPQRLLFEGTTPREAYLAAYQGVDLALDPFPYPGGTTTAEGLWMGVPVLTLHGDRFIGHQGETLLRNVDLADWIAADRDDYVARAIRLSSDLDGLAALRGGLRARLLASPLCDAPRFAGNFVVALRGMWQAWLESNSGAQEPLAQMAPPPAPEIALESLTERALAYLQAGRVDEALARYQAILENHPHHAPALSHLGLALCQQDRLHDALPYLRRALEIDPGAAQTLLYLGLAHKQLGEMEAAAVCFRRAAELEPDDYLAHSYLGSALRDLDRHDQALASYQRALDLQPAVFQTHNNLADILYKLGRFEAAADRFRQALKINPGYAIALNNLGNTLKALGQTEEAVDCYRRAIALDPAYHEAHNNLGVALQDLDRFDAALDSYRDALRLKPDFAEAHSNFASTLQDLGHLGDSIASYRRAIELQADNAEVWSNLLFCQNYLAEFAPSAMLAEARRYGDMALARALPYAHWNSESRTGKRLRVGLVSGDLRNHPVGFFLEATLAALDPARVELFAYVTSRREDALTGRIKPLFARWQCIQGIADADAARRIHDDSVDILIDLAGHTAHNRLPLFAWKPAPVQATWLGYFATTGVPGIDYLLADPQVVPAGEEGHFSETILRLPEVYYCFTPPDAPVEPSAAPALTDGRITFGGFNKLAKMNDAVVALWARLLHAVPDSRLFLKAKGLTDPGLRKSILERYAAHGIGPDRLLLEGASPRHDYLAAYHRVDIALDPFPYPGGTTTADALWMGVPVLTLRGDRFIGHQGETLLTHVGLPDWIAADPDDYLAKALAFAADLAALAGLRGRLRTQFLASPLCDAPRFARNLEEALRKMWNAWCEGKT
jgi:predicted O-linked N-acetylglucosamine transferase (SPINDLY family)